MIRSLLFYSSVFLASVGSLSAAIVGYTFTGKTYLSTVTGFEDEYPLGSEYELRVEWDDTAVGGEPTENQAGYPLTKFTFTIKGKSGDWTTSSLPGKASFTLNRFGSHEIQFTSGWGPENHTNGTIAGGQTYSINLILSDPTNTALPNLSPIPGAIDPSIWSSEASHLKFYLTDMAKGVYGDVSGLGVTSVPPAPEIAVKDSKGEELISGESTIGFKAVKKGKAGETKKFSIQNSGTAPLQGIKLTMGGKNKKDFRVGRFSKKSLSPGEKATLRVTFKPTAKGKRKGVVRVESNDADESPFEITLAGSGK